MRFLARQLATSLCLLALAAAVASAQQPAIINGRVTGPEGNAIGFASVAIPSLNLSTTARNDGTYALFIPGDRVRGQTVAVVARAINYKPSSVLVALREGEISQDFGLASNPLQLGEIVIIGAGATSALEKIGNVRNSVDSASILRSNEPNIISALSAKAPNVIVTTQSGDPGASASIQIRGANTLGSTGEPLIIVDGIPIDNTTVPTSKFDGTTFAGQQGTSATNRASDINPVDIESVEILKGAAAGALYGARAGQGVILITTRKGRPGPTSYQLRSTFGLSNVTALQELQTQYGQGSGGTVDACASAPTPDCYATSGSWGPSLAPGTPTYDHAHEMFDTGYLTDNTLTMAGGNDRTAFYLSASLLNQTGTFIGPQNKYNRKSFRLKGSQQLRPNLTIGANVAYSNAAASFVQRGSNFSGLLLGAYRTPPDFNNAVYLDPGSGLHRSYRFPLPSANSIYDTRAYDNPFFTANVPISTSIEDRVTGNVDITYVPLSWLTFNYTLGVDYSGDDRVQGQPPTSSNTPVPGGGQVIKAALTNTQFDHNLIGTAAYAVNPNVSGTITLGQNINTRSARTLGAVGDKMLAFAPFDLLNTASVKNFDDESKRRIIGYFGQATLDLGQQLYLKGALRRDGASAFAPDKQWAWFPSATAAWQFTRVTGDLGGIVSYGKARVAYGEVGTQPEPYQTSVTFVSCGQYTEDYGGSLGACQNGHGGFYTSDTLPSGLKPERTREIETGLDIGLFKDAADLSFTWYRRRSTDVIFSVQTAPSSGYSYQAKNGAEILNRGTEWMLNIRPITTRDFAWDVGFQVGTNRNKVVDFAGDTKLLAYGNEGGFGISYAAEGRPIGVFRDYDYIRCGVGKRVKQGAQTFSVDGICAAEGAPDGALFINDGSYRNAANNPGQGAGFPLLDPNPRFVGDPNPKWTGSVRTGVRFKKFSFSGLLDIRHGGKIYNGTRGALNYLGTSRESGDLRGKTVTFGDDFFGDQAVAGPGAGTPVVLDQDWFQKYYTSFALLGTPFYEDASFVKLREISVGYTLDGPWVARTFGLSSIDLRVSGRNLKTWDNYLGQDPETNLAGAETGARNIDWFNNPQARSFVFSVSLNR